MSKKQKPGPPAVAGAAGRGRQGSASAGARARRGEVRPTLLAGGNPQVAKGDGEPPVRAYIAAMPGWKHSVGAWIDAVVAAEVPGVRKAVRWNSPFYGVEGRGWFLSFHCFSKYIKVTFFRGRDLEPPPPVGAKAPAVRCVHLAEGEDWEEARFRDWVRQASQLPGEELF